MTLPRPRPWDLVLGVLAAAGFAADGLVRGEASWASIVALSTLTCLPLVWRTAVPLRALLAVCVGVASSVVVFKPYDTAIVIVALALYTVALLGDRRRSLVVGAGVGVFLVMVIVSVGTDGDWATQFVLRLLFVVGALAVGDTVRSRRALVLAERERAGRIDREREQDSRRRVADERLRIARELHDTIAHALVAINVRAGVAAHLGDPDGSSAALLDIKHTSAQALGDLRATLGLLREDGEGAPRSPVFDLRSVEQLVGRARAAGLEASADVELSGHPIPSAVGQAAFRIVQEALTNVLRHARATRARISVHVVGQALAVEITDDGPGPAPARPRSTGLQSAGPASAGPAEGHGLRGMSERASALGGSLNAGPIAGGGWRVFAHLPLATADRG